jgi:hypothetical protein
MPSSIFASRCPVERDAAGEVAKVDTSTDFGARSQLAPDLKVVAASWSRPG